MRFVLFALSACSGSVTTDAGSDAAPVAESGVDAGQPACSGTRCPYDPLPNDFTVEACKAIEASACAGAYDDWATCVDRATTCDVQMRTDPASKLAAYQTCKPKYDALQSCCSTKSLPNCPTSR